MAKEFLNDFEELILTLVTALREDAYGASVTIEIERWLERKVTLSAVHVTLYRLEDKGYVKSKVGGATNERGGRCKRIYTITNAGLAVLRSMKETRTQIWKLVPQLKIIASS
jgi:PadR family transcriptional regulator PadR